MLIPYSTDAPIYHWPFATGGLIVVNTFVTLVTMLIAPEDWEKIVEPWILSYGDGLHPLQWISSNFLHAGLFHLIGNMIWLWIFGMIVEGKIGWWRFLLVYIGIGVIQCAIEQTITLGFNDGGSLGASAVIYGLMMMALVWAPKNDINCVFIFFRLLFFTAPILVLAIVSIVLQVLFGILTAFAMDQHFGTVITSEILHLMGAAAGFGVGVVMLKKDWVDCENWDLFSVMADRHLMSDEELEEKVLPAPPSQQQSEEQGQQDRNLATSQILDFVTSGQPMLAYQGYLRSSQVWQDWTLDEPTFVRVIDAFHQQQMWSESIPVMREYLQKYSERAVPIRLKLAAILLKYESRPGQALKVLSKLNPQLISPKEQKNWERIHEQAQTAAANNPYEICDDDF